MNTYIDNKEKQLQAVSLIEVSFVMIIAGFLMMMAMQGWKYVEQAKMYGMVQQITQMRIAYDEAKNTSNLTEENFMEVLYQHGGPKVNQDKCINMPFAICKCEKVYPPMILMTNMKENHAHRLKSMLESGGQNVEIIDDNGKKALQIIL